MTAWQPGVYAFNVATDEDGNDIAIPVSSGSPCADLGPDEIATPRIGYRMRELADIVSAMPGCSKSDALRAAGLPVRGMGSGRELNRAISAGLVLVEHEHAKRCRLFATERDRRRWHLVRELLLPGIPAGRVAEIRAEITALDAERAATWRTS
jgi:hypothetical protein